MNSLVMLVIVSMLLVSTHSAPSHGIKEMAWLTVPLVNAPRQQKYLPSSVVLTPPCISTMVTPQNVLRDLLVTLLLLMLVREILADLLRRRRGDMRNKI